MTCANCQAALQPTDHYCGQCGQEVASRSVPLRVLLRQWWDDELGLDGKLIRTLRVLLTQPGLLTRRWIDGQRRSYTDPLKLYFVLALGYVLIYQREMSEVFDAQFATQRAELATKSPEVARILSRIIDSFYRVMVEQMEPLLLLSVPLFAWGSWVMLRRREPLYVHHLVGGLHFYSLTMLVGMLLAPIGLIVSREWEYVGLYGIMVLWSALHFRRLYRLDTDTLIGVMTGVWVLSLVTTMLLFLLAWVVNFVWLTYGEPTLQL